MKAPYNACFVLWHLFCPLRPGLAWPIAVPWLDGPRNTKDRHNLYATEENKDKVSATTTCPSRAPPPPAGQRGRRIYIYIYLICVNVLSSILIFIC